MEGPPYFSYVLFPDKPDLWSNLMCDYREIRSVFLSREKTTFTKKFHVRQFYLVKLAIININLNPLPQKIIEQVTLKFQDLDISLGKRSLCFSREGARAAAPSGPVREGYNLPLL